MFKEPLKGKKRAPDIVTMLKVFACNCSRRTLSNKCLDIWPASPYPIFFPIWGFLVLLGLFKIIKEHELHGIKPDLCKPKTFYKLNWASNFAETFLWLPSDTCKVVWMFFSKKSKKGQKAMAWMEIQGGGPWVPLCITETCKATAPFTPEEETALQIFWQGPFVQYHMGALQLELRPFMPHFGHIHCESV